MCSRKKYAKLINNIIPIGLRNKWSKESVKKMVNASSLINLLKLIVEFTVISQVGKIFYQSTYSLEGNNPLGASC